MESAERIVRSHPTGVGSAECRNGHTTVTRFFLANPVETPPEVLCIQEEAGTGRAAVVALIPFRSMWHERTLTWSTLSCITVWELHRSKTCEEAMPPWAEGWLNEFLNG